MAETQEASYAPPKGMRVGPCLTRLMPMHPQAASRASKSMARNKDLRLKPCPRSEEPGQQACQQHEKIDHRARTSPDSPSARQADGGSGRDRTYESARRLHWDLKPNLTYKSETNSSVI
jgi:hypothetical protein